MRFLILTHYLVFTLSITSDSADAEDLVQETYLRAYQKFDQFEFGISCKAWLFKIMRNIAIDQIRKKDPLLMTGNESCDDETASTHVKVDHLPHTIDIKRSFSVLPFKYRIVVLLKDIEGFLLPNRIGSDGASTCLSFSSKKTTT